MDWPLYAAADGSLDWILQGGDLVLQPTLESAVILSLFADRRARPDERVPSDAPSLVATSAQPSRPVGTQVGGWWAEDPTDPYGSGLWLLGRELAVPLTAARAEQYAREALSWMVRELIVEAVEVAAQMVDGVLVLEVVPVRGSATRWAESWDGTLAGHYRIGAAALQILKG